MSIILWCVCYFCSVLSALKVIFMFITQTVNSCYGPIYRLLADSRFLQILSTSFLMSYHTIFQDVMDSNNLFHDSISYLMTFSPHNYKSM